MLPPQGELWAIILPPETGERTVPELRRAIGRGVSIAGCAHTLVSLPEDRALLLEEARSLLPAQNVSVCSAEPTGLSHVLHETLHVLTRDPGAHLLALPWEAPCTEWSALHQGIGEAVASSKACGGAIVLVGGASGRVPRHPAAWIVPGEICAEGRARWVSTICGGSGALPCSRLLPLASTGIFTVSASSLLRIISQRNPMILSMLLSGEPGRDRSGRKPSSRRNSDALDLLSDVLRLDIDHMLVVRVNAPCVSAQRSRAVPTDGARTTARSAAHHRTVSGTSSCPVGAGRTARTG